MPFLIEQRVDDKDMWLPDKVYKLLPWAYVAMGLLFFAGVYYLGQSDFGAGFYVATGLVSIAGGLIVHYLRVHGARHDDEGSEGDSTTS